MIATDLMPLKFNAGSWQDVPPYKSLQAKFSRMPRVRGESHTSRSMMLFDAINVRKVVERMITDNDFPSFGDSIKLDSVIDLGKLRSDLTQRSVSGVRYWVDGGEERQRSDWQLARRNGWVVKLPKKNSRYSQVLYIRNCLRQGISSVDAGYPTTICLFTHSDRFARVARKFCKSGGRLMIVGYVGYLQRRLYELTYLGANLLDIVYDCGAGKLKVRGRSPNRLASRKSIGVRQ